MIKANRYHIIEMGSWSILGSHPDRDSAIVDAKAQPSRTMIVGPCSQTCINQLTGDLIVHRNRLEHRLKAVLDRTEEDLS